MLFRNGYYLRIVTCFGLFVKVVLISLVFSIYVRTKKDSCFLHHVTNREISLTHFLVTGEIVLYLPDSLHNDGLVLTLLFLRENCVVFFSSKENA